MKREKIIAAGAGGQGALRIGQMIAYAALDEGWEVEWLPSYGAEMRGGTANCSVTVSEGEIDFPLIRKTDYCIVMNDLSLARFEPQVLPGGHIIINCSMIDDKIKRDDINAYYIPADSIAEEEGNPRGANMVMLGAFLALTDIISIDSVCKVIDMSFTGSKAKYAESNRRLIRRGYDLIEN